MDEEEFLIYDKTRTPVVSRVLTIKGKVRLMVLSILVDKSGSNLGDIGTRLRGVRKGTIT